MIAAREFAHLTTERHIATSEQVKQLSTWTHALLGESKPKAVKPGGERTPILVFTDAACEDDVASWEMVRVDSISTTRTAAGGRIPAALVQLWKGMGSQQVITLAEALRCCWHGSSSWTLVRIAG